MPMTIELPAAAFEPPAGATPARFVTASTDHGRVRLVLHHADGRVIARFDLEPGAALAGCAQALDAARRLIERQARRGNPCACAATDAEPTTGEGD